MNEKTKIFNLSNDERNNWKMRFDQFKKDQSNHTIDYENELQKIDNLSKEVLK